MNEWEFLVTVRVIVGAHCEADAREALVDSLDEVNASIEEATLVGGPGPSLSIITD